MEKIVRAIRGAVFTENTKEAIQDSTCRMFREVILKNKIASEDLISIQFTLTRDLDVLNPATALRLGGTPVDIKDVPLFCSQEAFIQGGFPKVIRLMITAYVEKELKIQHVYIDGAEKLRPDIAR